MRMQHDALGTNSYKWMFDCHNVGYFLDMDFTSGVWNMVLVMSVKLNETV